MLANIMDGQPSAKDKKNGRGTTLLVLPPGIVGQWKREIQTHCNPEYAGTVFIYKSSEFADNHSHPLEALKGFDIM